MARPARTGNTRIDRVLREALARLEAIFPDRLKTGRYVTSKRNCHMLYRNYINDEWAGLLDDLYSWCRSAWQYLIPESADDQQRLQVICQRALAFENHFLARYKGFLLTALHVMSQLPFNDVQITDTMHALARDKRPDIQKLAQETLMLLQRR